MTRARMIVAVVAAGLACAAVFYGSGGFDDTAATAASVKDCDSCSARKKDLSRLREALASPANERQ